MKLYVLSIHTFGEGTNNDEYFRNPGINIFTTKKIMKKALKKVFSDYGLDEEKIPMFMKKRVIPIGNENDFIQYTKYETDDVTNIEDCMSETQISDDIRKYYSEEEYRHIEIILQFTVLGASQYNYYLNRHLFKTDDKEATLLRDEIGKKFLEESKLDLVYVDSEMDSFTTRSKFHTYREAMDYMENVTIPLYDFSIGDQKLQLEFSGYRFYGSNSKRRYKVSDD